MSEIIYAKKDHLAYSRLNRHECRNAITRSMVTELANVWTDIRDNN